MRQATHRAEAGRGRKAGLSEYARRTSQKQQNVSEQYRVGEVVEIHGISRRFPWLLDADPFYHLLEIAKAPEPCRDPLADIVDEGQAKGEIATQGQRSNIRPANVSPLPLPAPRLAECRRIRDAFTEDDHKRHYDETQILDLIVSLNVERRHLNAGQKAFLAQDYHDAYAEAAKEVQREAGARGGSRSPYEGTTERNKKVPADRRESPTPSPSLPRRERESATRAAKAVGASGRSVQRARAVQRDTPDLADKVRRGEMALDAADRERRQRIRATPKPKPPPTKNTPNTRKKNGTKKPETWSLRPAGALHRSKVARRAGARARVNLSPLARGLTCGNAATRGGPLKTGRGFRWHSCAGRATIAVAIHEAPRRRWSGPGHVTEAMEASMQSQPIVQPAAESRIRGHACEHAGYSCWSPRLCGCDCAQCTWPAPGHTPSPDDGISPWDTCERCGQAIRADDAGTWRTMLGYAADCPGAAQ